MLADLKPAPTKELMAIALFPQSTFNKLKNKPLITVEREALPVSLVGGAAYSIRFSFLQVLVKRNLIVLKSIAFIVHYLK